MKTRDSSQHAYKWARMLCSIGSLFLLFVVCQPAFPQNAPREAILLDKTHKVAGIECNQCHKQKPPAAPPAAVCGGCHKDIAKSPKTKDGLANPHDAHMSYPECSDCHHVHKPSQNQCAGCHNFSYKMR